MEISIDQDGPLLIFGGPYSNLQATAAMHEAAGRLGIPANRVICTGDVVAYCADPEETVRLIRAWGCYVIKGNCEESLAERAPDCGCGFAEDTACDLLSKGWYPYADARISEDSRNWMAGLPDHLTFRLGAHRACVIHGGVVNRSRFLFASDEAGAKREECDAADADIMIAGHCGLPFIQRLGTRLWCNPGVIGMPANDGTPDGWYGVITATEAGLTVRLHRLPYDAALAAGRLRDAGSAPAYANALISGLWPSLDVLPQAERAVTGVRLEEAELTFHAAHAL